MNWIPVSERLPEICQPVIGFSDEWVHPDYNPNGFHECFLMDDGSWMSSEWNNTQDCWSTINDTIPTHWMLPIPPV